MKMIRVATCGGCPYILDLDEGYCDSFIKCRKFNIMLFDWDGPEDFDYQNGIHPDCKLEVI